MDEIREEIEKIWDLSIKDFEKIDKEEKSKVKEKDKPEARKIHCEKVFEFVDIITTGIDIDNTIEKELKISALLHDIKKYEKPHSKNSAKYIKKNFYIIGLDNDDIYNIVRYHSTPGKNEKDKLQKHENKISNDIKKAIFIIRVSDELSKEEEINRENIKKIVKKVYKRSITDIVSEEEKQEIENILINMLVIMKICSIYLKNVEK